MFALLSLLMGFPSRQTRLFVYVFDCLVFVACLIVPKLISLPAQTLFFLLLFSFINSIPAFSYLKTSLPCDCESHNIRVSI